MVANLHRNSPRADPVLIATIMRPEGETGVQTHFRSFTACLNAVGRQNELITPYCAPLWQVYPVFGLRKLVNPLNGEWGVWWYRHWHAWFLRQALTRRLRTDPACVIYAQCPLSAHAALGARLSRRQRVVMAAHFNISQADEWAGKGFIRRGGPLYRAIQAFEVDVLPRLDGLVHVSDFMRGQLERRIPALSQVPSMVIPNFIEDPGPPPTVEPQTDLVTVGTLEQRKNQRYALDILAAANAQGRRLTLTVMGDGPGRAGLEADARGLGIADQVRFAGFVARASEQMPGHRACLHVARMESFGIVLIEAMARGLPVFAPAVGGIPEVFDDGCEGRVIPLDDAPAAARIIIDGLDGPRFLAAAGAAARARFERDYTASRVAARLDAYLQAARDRRPCVAVADLAPHVPH